MSVNPDLFDIDPENLDEEWLSQPKHFLRYLLKAADARETLDRAKAALDVTKAELDIAIRSDPEAFDLGDKITENLISNTIILQRDYKDALKDVNEAKHELDVVQAVVQAMEHRKRALENMVQLHALGYFSEPSAGSAGREVVGEIMKRKSRKSGQSVVEDIQRRKRRTREDDDE